MIVVGAPLGGLLADAIGFRVVLWFSVAGFLVIAAALFATPYRHARLDEAPSLIATRPSEPPWTGPIR
jgi:predicted MFS family arabinose efflux permease